MTPEAPAQWSDLLDAATRAARIGGDIILAASLLHRFPPEAKGPGEEQGVTRADLGWVVDPLDGTANFVHGFPAVGVSVALVERGSPVVGVVYAPVLDDTWAAVSGGGLRYNGEAATIASRNPAQSICGTGFPFKARPRLPLYLQMFEGAFRRFEDLRRPGAATLDLAWVGSGVFDGFFELGLGPWDVAAGALLVREAGGVVTDWRGDERAWLESGDILAGPPAVHAVLLELAGQALSDGGRQVE